MSCKESLIAIGDLQGCFESLMGLLDQLPRSASLIFLGDIVNRGPESLKTLRFVKDLCEKKRARIILGNHDLHLLAVAATGKTPSAHDTITDILQSPDREELLGWLASQPLVLNTEEALFVHAGIPPQWTLEKTLTLAKEASEKLTGTGWKIALQHMYGNDVYSDTLTGEARLRGILNAFTRTRFLKHDLTPDYSVKEGLAKMPAGDVPWFEVPRLVKKPICFGHWSMLGLVLREKTIAVDTGCLWGGSLSAVRLTDKRLYQEPCPCWAAPGA